MRKLQPVTCTLFGTFIPRVAIHCRQTFMARNTAARLPKTLGALRLRLGNTGRETINRCPAEQVPPPSNSSYPCNPNRQRRR